MREINLVHDNINSEHRKISARNQDGPREKHGRKCIYEENERPNTLAQVEIRKSITRTIIGKW